jgi:hypothetical protein
MKLTPEIIDLSLDHALDITQEAELKAWLKSHPADAAKLERARRLRAQLVKAKPQPTSEQSRRMWAAIQAQTGAAQARGPVIQFSEPWYAFLTRPWALGGGVAAGLVTALLLILRPWAGVAPAPQPPAMEEAAPSVPETAPAPRVAIQKKSAAPTAKAAPMAAAPMVASAAEPTSEVEKALADSSLDDMIDSYLASQRRQAAQPSSLSAQPSLRASRAPSRGGASLAGLDTYSRADAAEPSADATSAGSRGQDGFWDWQAAAMALNRHDWPQAKLELLAARSQASEASERAFASSALTLLSAPGAPLADQLETLPRAGELRVLGAGRWQLLVGNRLARFSEGVSARLPGFRAEGDSLVLDMTFDRGSFSPGTRFVRLSGETPAQVFDAQGLPLMEDEFSATAGATYHVSGKQLRLR